MNAEVERVFGEVADLSSEQRQCYFERNAVAPEIRNEVESLLAFEPDATRHLAEKIFDSATHLLETPDSMRCGPWQLGKLLGRGGMGSVYLAERQDGEVRQQAAVKLIPAYRPDLRARFLRERQILASLNHPNIARLFDAGHEADGRPYLVMEYIDGVAIDGYAAKLPLAGKLHLFLDVCSAVSHAHRQCVIHRDVKPSNILITAEGEPKLLDFGIAKIIDASDPSQTVERFLTPGYSSPEQVRGGTIATATDIYSLGAVLYCLLTGVSPHDPQAWASSVGSSDDSWPKIILSREPRPPSTLNPNLPRDLDCIVGKTLRTDPGERYSSVDQFAEDLRALLEKRPVRARSGGAWYRAAKFLRRNWAPATAAAMVLIAFNWGVYALNRERALAQQRFQQVRQLANRLFDIDVEVRRTAGTTGARQMIVDTSLEYLERLAPHAVKDPDCVRCWSAAGSECFLPLCRWLWRMPAPRSKRSNTYGR
ncbi:MAG: serine/threonine protein kinase [Acidobacteria bacterium]|nr:serine/threonine protein kinase [Acidobacteriota bacterium]